MQNLVRAIAALAVAAAMAAPAFASTAAAPSNTVAPTITGTPTVGDVLQAVHGGWRGTKPIAFSYAWKQCDAAGGACKSVPSDQRSSYTLVAANAGNTMRVVVTASNVDGVASAVSAATPVIAAAATTTTTTTTTAPPAASNGCGSSGGSVPVASITSPAHLVIDAFTVTPSHVTQGTRALTLRVHVTACGGSVDGALVYVTAVPFGMFDIPPETATGADGWVSLPLTALPGFPVSPKQQLVVVFVRARKAGEDLLGGISARRLVSFPVAR